MTTKPWRKHHELEMTELSRNSFMRNEDTLISEMSTLGFRPGTEPMEPIYNDACDVGIAIRGHHRTVRFLFTERTGEDGNFAWHFKPLDDAGGIKKLVIFND